MQPSFCWTVKSKLGAQLTKVELKLSKIYPWRHTMVQCLTFMCSNNAVAILVCMLISRFFSSNSGSELQSETIHSTATKSLAQHKWLVFFMSVWSTGDRPDGWCQFGSIVRQHTDSSIILTFQALMKRRLITFITLVVLSVNCSWNQQSKKSWEVWLVNATRSHITQSKGSFTTSLGLGHNT